MGRQIVYCEGCGNSLREDDFDRGKARLLDNRPFCTQCRPFKDGEEPQRRASSGKVPAPPPRKSATERVPIVAPPPRRPAPGPQSNPLPIIAAVGAILLLILIFAATRSGTPPPAPPSEKPSTPLIIDLPKSRPPADSPTPPPPPVNRDPQPPPPPPPRRDPPSHSSKPSDPLHVPTAAEKFDAFLAQIRQMIQDDARKERHEEILRMFAAAAKIAGLRASEVEKMKLDYLGTLDESIRRAALWSDWKITSSHEEGSTGMLPSYGDRSSVVATHPLNRTTPARIEREVDIPSGKKTTLSFSVSCHQKGDFELRVYVDGKEALKEMIGGGPGWRDRKIDLSLHAGRRVALRLENFPNNWSFEHAYWSDLVVVSE